MAKKEINPFWIILILIGIAYLYTNSSLFAITLESSQIQYYNEDILVKFETDLTSPTIKAYYNDIELSEIVGNETIQNIVFTSSKVNNTYILRASNVTQTGIFKFSAIEGNITETQVVEVRRPYVDQKNDIPTSPVEEGVIDKFTFETFTPQGEILEADAIDITLFDPDNVESTLTPKKIGTNKFEISAFTFEDAGNYQFKIKPRKEGFDTKEFTVITPVTKSAGIHPIIFIIFGAGALWILLFAIKRIRR